MKLRLDKYLVEMGKGTRSEIKRAASKGQITVNEQVVKKTDLKIDTENDIVFFQGTEVKYLLYEYYMLNKPAGVVSATTDRKEKTVLDLIEDCKRNDLFPVGRLDKDTEGLLLITNDGMLAHQLLSPKKHVAKTYFVKVLGEVTSSDIQAFQTGVDIGEKKPTLPATLEIQHSAEISEVLLTIHEGKFHQVKRMFEAVGKKVLYLKRLQMGNLKLDETLSPGEYRELTKEEVAQLC
ncbi:MAG: rRNA pseudouridine synthase [Candidatus Ruminococcus intestinipullorum]|nr:rRNA pseudouridine synthase [Candidatus Ruminococcus intestinipullorum]